VSPPSTGQKLPTISPEKGLATAEGISSSDKAVADKTPDTTGGATPEKSERLTLSDLEAHNLFLPEGEPPQQQVAAQTLNPATSALYHEPHAYIFWTSNVLQIFENGLSHFHLKMFQAKAIIWP